MALQRLRIEHLRCLTDVDIELHPDRNYVFGPNGSGKTSLLEAVHLLGRARSFRTRHNRRLVQRGQPGFSIHGQLDDGVSQRRLGMGFEHGQMRLRIDGRDAAGSSALAGLLAVHVIDPGTHGLIDGGPGERRRFMDWGVFHVEHDYLPLWRHYRRVLGQRNAALKASSPANELAIWTASVIETAEAVDAGRARYIGLLAPIVEDFGQSLLQAPVSLRYRSGWPDGVSFAAALDKSIERDRQTGITQVGPHRADLAVTIGESKVRDQASRGQQKLVAAALMLGQAALYGQAHRQQGILLVDDPAAELDRDALGRLIAVLDRIPAQLILTGLAEAALAPLAAARVFHVEQGNFKGVYNIEV